MREKLKVLITVKTYPMPSDKYDELVCTAGVLEDGTFIRLYPINYRSKPYDNWYKKYQWVEVEVEKNKKDYRPESFKPIGDLKPIGEIVSTKNNWSERKSIVLKKYGPSMCDLNKTLQKDVSLGIIKPRIVEDIIKEETERQWKPQWIANMIQMNMFNQHERNLEKIPYKFRYNFKCMDPNCKGHKMMIEDWELGQLYRTMRDKYHDEKVACDKVKFKFLNDICGEDKDTYFYVGTTMPNGTWVVIGTFHPKLENIKFDI